MFSKIALCLAFSILLISSNSHPLTPVYQPVARSLAVVGSKDFSERFSGTISNLKIQMSLKRAGNNLSGKYFYDKNKKDLNLTGTINSSGFFKLQETDEKGNNTGEFNGKVFEDKVLAGIWQNVPNDGYTPKRLPFQMAIGDGSSATFTPEQTPEIVKCAVKNDKGELNLGILGSQLIIFDYTNVGGNGHTCSALFDRFSEDTEWLNGSDNIIKFKVDDAKAEIKVLSSATGYTIYFNVPNGGNATLCGLRSILPKNIQVKKTKQGYTAQAELN